MAQTEVRTPKPMRLWPGVVIVVLQWMFRFGYPLVRPDHGTGTTAALGGLVGAVALILWWTIFSRARWFDRVGGVLLLILAPIAALPLYHESIGPHPIFFYAIPVLCLAFVVGIAAGRGLSEGARRWTAVAAVLLASGAWALVRTEGVTGDHTEEFKWRWAATSEERFLAEAGDEMAALSAAAAEMEAGADWPGFRGPARDSVVRGVRIETDWSATPPVELWRRPVGPAWSSFAVAGDLLYTQEQRGEEEIVACYRATTGELVWSHSDAARFWEPMGGAGPRGTPAVRDGRVYAFGGTGILNALDAKDGSVIWSRNLVPEAASKVPDWGFSSSPLVVDDLVIVDTASKLVAYDVAAGEPRWSGPGGGFSFSSPHLVTLDGIEQVLLLDGAGVTSVAPGDGTPLWEHAWPGDSRIVQPALTAGGDILLGSGFTSGMGTRRIAVSHSAGDWTVEERWTSNGLKPYFNDLVVHNGHAFGFDGRILAAIDLEDGERKWKGGRYGHGQLLLLPEQDLLLVVSEQGDLALVSATPDRFTELARVPGIKGKTWNHPALLGDVLLVRNGREMAAFRLALAAG